MPLRKTNRKSPAISASPSNPSSDDRSPEPSSAASEPDPDFNPSNSKAMKVKRTSTGNTKSKASSRAPTKAANTALVAPSRPKAHNWKLSETMVQSEIGSDDGEEGSRETDIVIGNRRNDVGRDQKGKDGAYEDADDEEEAVKPSPSKWASGRQPVDRAKQLTPEKKTGASEAPCTPGKWSAHGQNIMFDLIYTRPDKVAWTDIAQHLPGRNVNMCKMYFNKNLRPKVDRMFQE